MEKIAIHCKTQEEYDQLMEICEKKGWKRRNGLSPKIQPNVWIYYKDQTTVDYCEFFQYTHKCWYKNTWYKILTFNELLEMEWLVNFKRGDRVLVFDGGIRQERIYLATIEWTIHPYVCVYQGYEGKFNDWEKFPTTTREYIKPLPAKKELTLQEIADKFGVKVEDIRIKD